MKTQQGVTAYHDLNTQGMNLGRQHGRKQDLVLNRRRRLTSNPLLLVSQIQ